MSEAKTRAFTRAKGSYTLEAAVILPLVAAFWVCILFFTRVLQVETAVQEALLYAARTTAVEASVSENPAALKAAAWAHFQTELRNYDLPGQYVKGGNAGVSLLGSDCSSEYIVLQADYRIAVPVAFFQVSGIQIRQKSVSRKWTGRDVAAEEEDPYVYITQYGSVYHRTQSCSYLDLKIRSTDLTRIAGLRNSDGGIYYPCPTCGASGVKSGTVYYTPYGGSYHKSLSCSGLKRTIYVVHLSETGGKRACSKCGG